MKALRKDFLTDQLLKAKPNMAELTNSFNDTQYERWHTHLSTLSQNDNHRTWAAGEKFDRTTNDTQTKIGLFCNWKPRYKIK